MGVLVACSGPRAPARTASAAPSFERFEIVEGVHGIRAGRHYSMFVVTSVGVVAFDPLSDSRAERYAEEIRAVAPGQPLVAIIYSHWHLDHAGGGRVLLRHFGEQVPIIAHERTLRRMRRWNERPSRPGIALPTDTVDDEGRALQFGDTTIELRYLGYAHTDTMLAAYLPAERLVFAVDFVRRDTVGFGPMTGIDPGELLRMHHRLLEIDFDTLVFGHSPAGGRVHVERRIAYFDALYAAVGDARERGLSADAAVTEIALPEYSEWTGYESWLPLNVRAVYRWMDDDDSSVE